MVASSDRIKFSPCPAQFLANEVALSKQTIALRDQRSRHDDVARTSAANESVRCVFAQTIWAHHGSVQGETFKTKLVLAGRPSVSLMSTRTICSPGGSSVSGMSIPAGITNCLMRGVRSTFGVRR